MARFKNTDWSITEEAGGTVAWDGVKLSVMMDIRDELQKLNALLHCPNFTDIPQLLRDIKTNTKRIPLKTNAKARKRS